MYRCVQSNNKNKYIKKNLMMLKSEDQIKFKFVIQNSCSDILRVQNNK